MFEITWGVAAGFVGFVVVVGPGFYWVGRLSKQVDRNTADIDTLFRKIDVIHEYVKNGGRPS